MDTNIPWNPTEVNYYKYICNVFGCKGFYKIYIAQNKNKGEEK